LSQPLWSPESISANGTLLSKFSAIASRQTNEDLSSYADLHRWSIEHSDRFWQLVWEFSGVIGENNSTIVVENPQQIPGAQWFPHARLNFAENLLRFNDDQKAMIFRNEKAELTCLSRIELREKVASISQALRKAGLQPGDRVAGFMPNIPEAVISMLAVTAAGGVWSSCSPDFGVSGVLDRFGQIEPKFLIASDGYLYNGKEHETLSRLTEIRAALGSLQNVIIVPFLNQKPPQLNGIADALDWNILLENNHSADLIFVRTEFNHPLYIMFSSGTTGVPKCIVHGVGGTLLQHLKEHQLHCNVNPGDRLFYFTTCGWMMWNWLVSGLASGATLMLYDGSPFYPDGNVLWNFAEQSKINVFGTSAKFLDACAKADVKPMETHSLPQMRSILSTGSPLSPEGFDYVYNEVKSDVCLSSISGGTDIISCFVGGCPNEPVWRGEIQVSALGMDIRALSEDAEDLPIDAKGELCCMNSFPSMPIGFWKDDDGSKYHDAYFDKYPGVWCHGDFVARTTHGGWIIYGRSDAVLNPGGVRIGTAEIYRQAEKVPEVIESLVIGQSWLNDVRVVLFVRLQNGVGLNDELEVRIRKMIRSNATPRHVPAKIVQVADIPRTKSGKIVELAVRKVVHGEEVKNRHALANPEALEHFANIPSLAE
jgi:acetoacetyl-CoA synthetase